MTTDLQEAQREREVQKGRADHLDAQVAVLESRLAELEQERASDAGALARLTHELEALREEQDLVTSRATLPLRRLERGLRWLGQKAAKAGGILARHLLFRRRSKG